MCTHTKLSVRKTRDKDDGTADNDMDSNYRPQITQTHWHLYQNESKS